MLVPCLHLDSVARTIKAGGVDQGKEPEPTIYWRNRKIDGPRYHIDYCFVPDYWIDESLAVDVGRFKEWVLSDEQVALMERESASLAREFKVAEQYLWRRPSRSSLGQWLSQQAVAQRPRGRLSRQELPGAAVRIPKNQRRRGERGLTKPPQQAPMNGIASKL